MSYRAIAAALALEDVSVGERLVAYSLASYAGRDHLAWPAARTAAVRAGLSRRQYLAARAVLVQRGVVVVEEAAGRATGVAVMRLRFAEDGPSVEREINAGLFEAVLARSSVAGGARALVTTLAALADGDGSVDGLSSEEICEASGLSDRSYRRARSELLEHGEITLEVAGGGRSRPNRWRVRDPRTAAAGSVRAAAPRRPSAASQMPLMTAVRDTSPTGQSTADEVAPRCVGSSAIDPGGVRNPGRNPGANSGQNRTPSDRETPAQTPAETPAPHARAGRESLNLRTTPPDPPEGGLAYPVSVIEEYVTDRGRRRRRRVAADPGEISHPTEHDRRDWLTIRAALRDAIGTEMFEIWFNGFALGAVSTRDRALLINGPAQANAWVRSRFGVLLSSLAVEVGRELRVASDRELTLVGYLEDPAVTAAGLGDPSCLSVSPDHKEVL